MKEVKKKYPVGIIKTKDGKIDICLTLQNEINWMKEMRSRLRKPVPISLSEKEIENIIQEYKKKDRY